MMSEAAPASTLKAPAARSGEGQTVPVLTIVGCLILIWYAAAIWLNMPFQLQLNPELAGMDLVYATWAAERPVLPSPHQVLAEIWKTTALVDITSKRSLFYHAWVTISSSLLGFAMGTLVGVLLAAAIVHVRALQKSLLPWIIASQTIPILAIAPIIIVVLGSIGITGIFPKALISAYLCFFPIAISMVKGLTSPDLMQLDLMRTYNASQFETFAKLRWPASVPFLFAGFKVAIAISLVGAIVGEMPTGAQAGLGARLLAGSYYGQTVQIWAALFMASGLAAFLVMAVAFAERVTLKRMGVKP
jgi:NitT/TauT family transport system permease protein